MRRPRLKDIAEKVGCSIAVVSHVVNNSAGNITCRNELRERILQTAAELDYAPHYASRALKSQRSFTIGVYIPPRESTSIGYRYESSIMMGVERVCREKSYDLLVISTGEGSDGTDCLAKLNTHRVDGLILLQVKEDSPWAFPLAEKNENIVAINYYGDANLGTINFNDSAAAKMAVTELYKLGHRKIGYIGALCANVGKGCTARLEGFRLACAELGIPANPQFIFDVTAEGSFQIDRSAMPKQAVAHCIADTITAMPLDKRPTALVGYSDASVVVMMRALQRAKIRLPEDISVVGIDDSLICTYVQPTLSSVRQPLDAMGEEAARYLIKQFEKRLAHGNEDVVCEPRWLKLAEPTFIKRESTRVL